MDTKLKRFIAKEGLILVSVILLGVMLMICAHFLKNITAPRVVTDQEIENPNAKCWNLMNIFYFIEANSIPIILLGYLLIRFVVWAIKTLKQKSVVI